jgi:hypothetical protein
VAVAAGKGELIGGPGRNTARVGWEGRADAWDPLVSGPRVTDGHEWVTSGWAPLRGGQAGGGWLAPTWAYRQRGGWEGELGFFAFSFLFLNL